MAGLKLRARATGELSNAKINLEATLREQTEYYLGDGAAVTPTPGGGGEDEEEGGSPL